MPFFYVRTNKQKTITVIKHTLLSARNGYFLVSWMTVTGHVCSKPWDYRHRNRSKPQTLWNYCSQVKFKHYSWVALQVQGPVSAQHLVKHCSASRPEKPKEGVQHTTEERMTYYNDLSFLAKGTSIVINYKRHHHANTQFPTTTVLKTQHCLAQTSKLLMFSLVLWATFLLYPIITITYQRQPPKTGSWDFFSN